MKSADIARKNRLSLIFLLAGIILSCLLMSLPLYRFSANVYSKKSSNTVVGDEKYKEVLAEVEAVAEEYRSQGMEVEISETVTERTNSKGETSSLVAFTIGETFTKNVWSFLFGTMPSAHVLRLMLLCMLLAVLTAFAGCAGSMDVMQKYLPKGAKHLRGLSCIFLLADLILTPVFVLMNNYAFWRRTSLYNQELITEGKEEWFAKLDSYIGGFHPGELTIVASRPDVGKSMLALQFAHDDGLVERREGR